MLFNQRQELMGRALLGLLTDGMANVQDKLTVEVDQKELFRLQGEHRGLSWALKCLTEPLPPKP